MKSGAHEEQFLKIEEQGTLLVERTLRSGQRVSYEGSITIIGDVNPGAEVVAGGNVVVMGSLRGIVHAGALGKEEAVVIAFYLQPTQLRIANQITRAPDGQEAEEAGYPEIARIKNKTVVIEKLKLT